MRGRRIGVSSISARRQFTEIELTPILRTPILRARVLRLPPYSPDDNPIEEMFSKFKQGLRQAKARTKAKLYDAVGDSLRSMTLKDILGWIRRAGLCATPG